MSLTYFLILCLIVVAGLIASGYSIWVWIVATRSLKRTEKEPWDTDWNQPVKKETGKKYRPKSNGRSGLKK